MTDRDFFVLLVDDSEEITTPLKFLLEKENLKVAVASNGLEALEFLKTHKFSLILLDFHMPKMNGAEFLKEKERIKNETPVILFSGESASNLSGLTSSQIRMLPKPFRFGDVLTAILEFSNCK